ncbi:hypothetical protein GCM10022243_14090 [Saccharothrix violaceirubra]|uniref:Amino acid adenylation domain-containing protein n=1 Tax=Saccharothrix violaceirubra TaxID=413306 RepID=A0A7W7T644_9PSEU|nr:non-ribosomal peptide synthetase [Saccharothrix violaceirubra]MBB4967283.1 amino acid adenylation domain-containing protein [Saccharothrix violaceirubra]
MTTSEIEAGRAELLRRRLEQGRSAKRAVIPRADRSGDLPLSYGQQQMWFLGRLDPGSAEYLIPVALRIKGALDVDALRAAWAGIVSRHEVLRTRYALVDDKAVQVVDEPGVIDLPVHDVDGNPVAVLDHVDRAARTGFDLEREWPVRAELIRVADDSHVFVAVFHHIAWDAWSFGVFADELREGYGAAVEKLPPAVAPPAVQFADYASWERERSEVAHRRHLDYWGKQLVDLEPLDLPTDRQRPAARDWRGAVHGQSVPEATAQGVRELAKRYGVTEFVVLLSAFQALLSRYTGRTDVAVGTMVSGRTRPELQRLIGYGINSLVVRTRWTPATTFAELLGDTRTAVYEAFDHQEVPFARLVDELQPQRDMSRTPLFQVAFTLHEAQDDLFALPGLEVSPLDLPSQVSRFDLTALVKQSRDGALRLELEYATALFDRTTVERLAGHYLGLLDAVIAASESRVSELEFVDAAERDLLVRSEVDLSFTVDQGVHALFAARAAAAPTSPAVVFGDEVLSYGELNARANRLARHLVSVGVTPGSLVGICLPRSADVLVSILGVLKAGAAYLPLDPAVPVDRLRFMVEDAGTTVVITDAATRDVVAEFSEGTRVVHGDPAIAAHEESDVDLGTGADDPIYVIYTSGSTGRPKGVCLTHRNVARLLYAGHRHYAFSPDDVWPLFHSYAFDVSVWEMWGALLYGGKLVVVPQSVTRSPEDFLDLLLEHDVTVLNQTPSAFKGLVNLAEADDPRLDALRLRAVVFAGEKLEMGELRPWVDRFGTAGPKLLNMYGITETTVHTTYYEVTAADVADGWRNPVGVPLADLRVHLYDPNGNLVPVGVPGEIHVGGPGVASGYLNRPALTAERFVPDPFVAGQRLYRSGDLARRNPDGSLEFLGRIDDQVKVRGFRIELGEIEAVLTSSPGVLDGAVLLREDVPGDRRIVGYVVPEAGAQPSPREVREFIGARLPEYMVPAAIVVLERLPLTNNGKLDKRALPAPTDDALAKAAYLPPEGPTQERIASLFGDLLNIDRVGAGDSFFDLGGNSMTAVALVGRLRAAGVDVAVRDVFENRSVAALSALVDTREERVFDRRVQPFELISDTDRARLPEGVVDAYPLSKIQTGMVVEMLTSGERAAYHNATSFRVRDDAPFDADALREAARVISSRHQVLRTSIDIDGYSVPMQIVHEDAAMGVEHFDVRGLDDEGVDAAVREFVAHERANPFDLAEKSLVRIGAHEADGNVWWFTITECHAVIEGWTHHTLLMDVLDCYRQIRDTGAPAAVEVPDLRYADFIAAELASLDSPDDRAYWGSVVDTYPRFAVPTGWGDPSVEPHTVTHAVPFVDLEPKLRDLAASAGASLKSVVLAAHFTVLSRLTEQESFLSGLVLHGRPEVLGAERVYGMFLNSLPFHHDRTARTWRDLVGAVFAQEAEVWPHRRFPMPVIQQELGGGERLLDVRFSFHDFTMVDRELVDYAASIDDSPTEFPLAVLARLGHVFLMANSAHFDRANVERIGALYREVFTAMAADPQGDPRVVPLPEAERRSVLAQPDVVVEGFAGSVLDGFEAQAARTPDAVAITYKGESTTYAELDRAANRLAHHLRDQGVGTESVVAVLVDRGPALMTALLATWKAGGAYVPLDPSYPVERVEAVVTDSGAVVAVTESKHTVPGVPTVLLDREAFADRPDTKPDVAVDEENLAYVIFTSGSTGRPKGVQISHRGLANHVRWAADELAGEGGAPVFSSVAFDLVVPNLYAPLVTGHRVAFLPQDLDLADLGALLLEAGPFGFIKLTPGHLDVIASQVPAGTHLADVLVVAGEPLTRTTVRRWQELSPDCRLINEYGPTEASVGTSIHPIHGTPTVDVLPIGKPLPGLTMYVLDARMHPVPIGVVGELYVGGTGVARGYAGQPAMTAERFLPNPFGPGRLYKSGDRVRRAADGTVEFLGRVDDQVKIRGYRVEPGEVRNVLLDHPSVSDAAVIADGTGNDVRLLGYVVSDVDGEELRRFCATRVPEYMVPAAVVRLTAIPLNANGKIDRRALPSVEEAAAEVRSSEPRTALERQIAEVWCKVLERSSVGVHDDFFAVGGHSIRAVAVVGALRAAGVEVGVQEVFRNRTIAELAEAISGVPVQEDAPRTPLETQIAEVWCRVLDLPSVGVHDDFFAVGGHSIRAVAVVGALRAAGVEVGVQDVFRHRTIAELAEAISGVPAVGGPRTPLEAQIAEVWRKVLDLPSVGIHDDFFAVGGHSIRAVAVVGALRAAGVEVGVQDVFRNRTIAELAEAISGAPAVGGPRTALETQIAEVWRKVLELPSVGVHDDFFAVGGHSIRAVAVVGALRAAGITVGVQDVFRHRTIAELAEAISGESAETVPGERLVEPFALLSAEDRAALPGGLADAYPLSRVQLGMVVEMLSDPTVNRYHNCQSFRVNDTTPFDVDALRRAAAKLVARHEVLRSAIHLEDYSTPLQLVHEHAELSVSARDLRDLDQAGKENAMREFVAHERATLFDLRTAPLERITVHVDGDDGWWLSVTVCHAITEGWSQRLVVGELLALYRAERDGGDAGLPALPAVRYADFIAAEQKSLASEETAEYWTSVVTGLPKFTLPEAWAGAPGASYILPVAFADLRTDLERLGAAAGAPFKSVLLGAHLAVLSRLGADGGFHSGLVSDSRPAVEGVERVPGMYLNTVPIAFEGRATTWRELVSGVFETETALWPHRTLPMPAIAALAGPGRLLDVMFSYRDFDAAETDLDGQSGQGGIGVGEGAGEGANEFPLAVSTVPGHLALTVDPSYVAPEHGRWLADLYRRVLEAMAADPDGDATAELAADDVPDWNDTAVEW